MAINRKALMGTVAAGALLASAGAAMAGGFAVREQSVVGQGASFAGVAAGSYLSGMFWNPAVLGTAGTGFNTESAYSLIAAHSQFDPVANSTTCPIATCNQLNALNGPAGLAGDTDTGKIALVAASYGSYRLSQNLVLGMSITAPFGLGSEADNYNWIGRVHSRSSKLLTINATPTVAYQIMPGLIVGAGVQMEYAKLDFKFAGATAINAANAGLDIEDKFAVGYTLGVHWTPVRGTTLGVGFRSTIEHDFEGIAYNKATGTGVPGVKATLNTPETVTFSLQQTIMPTLRLLGTVEWTNWSRFGEIPITCTANGTAAAAVPGFGCAAGTQFGLLDAHWHDGWYYSAGLEWDTPTPGLTVRTGIAWEKSPVQNATERLVQVPDSDRLWTSVGFSYKLFANMTVDFAYTHIFVEDAMIDRQSLTLGTTPGALRLLANREADVDIVSFGLRTKW